MDGENELSQLQSFGFLLPLIFLIVAAFILNVALTRALALQRPQIASLKALGYGNVAIGWHYLKWGFAIGAGGIVIGVVAGAFFGSMVIDLYNVYFRFPELSFGVPPSVVIGSAVLTFFAAGAGTFGAVMRAVRIPPAEAMRPEVPARYKRTLLETPLISTVSGNRRAHGSPQHRPPSISGRGLRLRHLLRGGHPDARPRLQRRDRSTHTDAVLPGRATRRHRQLRRAPKQLREVRARRLPGVIAVEPQRTVAVRVRAAHRERYLAITGVPATPRFKRIVDRNGEPIRLPPGGVVLSQTLANALEVTTGDVVTMEVLEGHRPIRQVEVTGLVDDLLGLSAYMDIDALHQMMQEGDVATGALMLVDAAQEAELSTTLKETPTVAGTGFKRSVLKRFREVLAANLGLSIFINLVFASVIAFGVVYNAARISLSERSRELASLRVLGFTRAEISLILMGELALLTLVSLPVGGVFGYSLAAGMMGSIDSEVYRFPLYVSRQAVAWSFLGIIGAALVSGLIVRRKLDALDLVAVLKIRE